MLLGSSLLTLWRRGWCRLTDDSLPRHNNLRERAARDSTRTVDACSRMWATSPSSSRISREVSANVAWSSGSNLDLPLEGRWRWKRQDRARDVQTQTHEWPRPRSENRDGSVDEGRCWNDRNQNSGYDWSRWHAWGREGIYENVSSNRRGERQRMDRNLVPPDEDAPWTERNPLEPFGLWSKDDIVDKSMNCGRGKKI